MLFGTFPRIFFGYAASVEASGEVIVAHLKRLAEIEQIIMNTTPTYIFFFCLPSFIHSPIIASKSIVWKV